MTCVALLHLDLCCGSPERNAAHLKDAINHAADLGADWVVTPETALQGYFWAIDNDPGYLDEQQPNFLHDFQELAAKRQLTLFFCCAELNPETWQRFNSCFVISSDGEIIGAHRKIRGHGSAEAWATRAETLVPIPTKPLITGVLICADSWHAEHAQALKKKGAEVLIVPAAWPPGDYGPGDCWEKRSIETGLPVWVCNQTGRHVRLDFAQATSVVVNKGQTVLSYHGAQEAILLFDWDSRTNDLEKPDWRIVTFKAGSGQVLAGAKKKLRPAV